MKIGIDASRAFQKNRTGIEEYSYQVIKYLADNLKESRVVLYVKESQKSKVKSQNCNLKVKSNNLLEDNVNTLEVPDTWKVKVIRFPFLWTHIGLSLELLFNPVDTLFIPAHVVPLYHSKNTIVTIHGLEYEFCPKAYSFWARTYMRWAIKRSCRVAKKIIAVSENTKKDLINLYKVPKDKVAVIYEGVNDSHVIASVAKQSRDAKEGIAAVAMLPRNDEAKPYLLFIGRLEARKNICGIVDAYKILKEKYQIPHDLILAGAPGYGYEIIKLKISAQGGPASGWENSKIIELGFVSEEEKWQLLNNADVFLFPTFYEGFGLPILEAQSVGVPVVASDNSSIPEITNYEINTKYENTKNLSCHSGLACPPNWRDPESSQRNIINSLDSRLRGNDNKECSALLVNPNKPEQIAEATYKLISDKALRDDIIEKGYENIKRFSWEKCAIQVTKLLNG